MSQRDKAKTKSAKSILFKLDPTTPVLIVTGPRSFSIRAGTIFAGHKFSKDTPVALPDGCLVPGSDYIVFGDDTIGVRQITSAPMADDATIIGGFHFAPGGNAKARAGGDATPTINPFSIWDVKRRPKCRDPRGMFQIDVNGELSWVDIYKLGKDHLKNGTSAFGVTIADGNDPPQNPAGGYFDCLDYEVAVAVMKHHGKTLLNYDQYRIAAFGVTEKTALGHDPKITGLDAPRTSERGGQQMSGNLYDWGHDGDPDYPRPSIFGGSWPVGVNAGSRYAYVGVWPDYSRVNVGARGRGDHLQLD